MSRISSAFIIFFFLSPFISNAENILPNNRHYTANHGLSQSAVEDVVQDSFGYLWLATQDGINKFDGYDFTVYRPGNENGNTQQYYRCLVIEGDYLYAGSWDGGLWRIHIPTDSAELIGLQDIDIREMVFDANGVLWIAASSAGVFSLSGSEKLHQYSLAKNIIINTVFYHPSGIIFVGTDDGLYMMDPGENSFQKLPGFTERKTIEELNIISMEFNNSESLWIGTQKGLVLYNFLTFSTDEFTSQSHPELTDDNIQEIFEYSGDLWIGSYSKGLYKLDMRTETFYNFSKLLSIHSRLQFQDISLVR